MVPWLLHINLRGSRDNGSVIFTVVVEDGVAIGEGPVLCSSPTCRLLSL